MSKGEERTTLVVPTELERGDAFLDGAVLASVALGTWFLLLPNAMLFGINVHELWPISIPSIVLSAIWTLTGEAITEVPFLGAVAAGVRRRLGLRRAHEWVVAYAHYTRVRTLTDLISCWNRSRLGRRLAGTSTKIGRISSKMSPILRKTGRQSLNVPLKAQIEIVPTTNYVMASPREQSDAMESLTRVLMGLSHRVQIIGRTRSVPTQRQWPKPPTLERSWLAVVRANDPAQLVWRVRTVVEKIEGVGLRCRGIVCEQPDAVAALEEWARRARRKVRLQAAERRQVRVHPDCLELDGGQAWCASMVLRLWPREVGPGWLGQALAGELPVDVGIHVIPQDAQRIARWLKRQQSWQTETGPIQDAGNQLGKRDAEETRMKLIARTDRPVKVAVIFTVWGDSRAQVAQHVDTLRHEIGLVLGEVRLAKYEQDYGREATEPTGLCRMLGVWRTLDCESVASTWIMQPATVWHPHGAEIGTTRDGDMLVALDPFDESLESFGGLVVAKTGAGKSFFLQLLSRRLEGVEVWVVEQHDPPEYATVPGVHTLNLADIEEEDEDARAERLRRFILDLWELAKRDPRPRLLILDELYGLLNSTKLAALVAQLVRRGRKHYLSLWQSTQQVRELLQHPDGLDNAAIRVYMKQHDRDLDDLCDAVGLGVPARKFLRTAGRGHALLDCGGMLIAVEIQATPEEHAIITTDPREKFGATGADSRLGTASPTGNSSRGSENGHLVASQLVSIP